ncbi:virion structural protein [Pseudomonas phage vB_Pae10145-KEN51]|uniref:PHIKZ135 n=8 Tax=root TaxID=1 RepID=Q8SD27_BPDPK|nr:hypothetical protein [Pseudomonas aeruginosa]NP_803701.1 virion structural protein [Pseudomonas phage phiKZ]YP_009617526.1 virion structural protein [Pseudomonas phage PA7]YP_009619749.1 virion structural protein [Pseudomonas phage SL2]QJB22806.1 hypothetical protein fnug_163 [Pseudomonas phage fnug]QOV08018.1 putative structural protein [Pseudomonas phage vB_PaeM_kmuB]UXD83146.1 virion structural protein [Pseudomonas phage Koomba boorn-mokiny kep-wari Wadjak 1]WNV47834.1 structural prote
MITFLPLDLKAKLASNYIVDEDHTLIQVNNKTHRVLMCTHGGFYTKDFNLRDKKTGLSLNKDQYKTTYLYSQLSEMTGLEVMGIVVVTDPNVSPNVQVTYRAVGGFFSISALELKAVFDKLELDELSFTWDDIIGKPDAYPPAPHGHEYWQIYGTDTMVTELNRIAHAYRVGRSAMDNAADDYYKVYLTDAKTAVDDYRDRVTAHLTDYNNPHADDRFKLIPPLDKISNWGFATEAESVNRNVNNKYMPIGGIYRILNIDTLAKLAAHIKNFNNPHAVTADQVGSYTKPVMDSKITPLLGINEQAANATTIGATTNSQGYPVTGTGKVYQNFWNDVRKDIPAEEVTSGVFKWNALGKGNASILNDPERYYLASDGTWQDWVEAFKEWNKDKIKAITLGQVNSEAEALNTLNTMFTDNTKYPEGTYAVVGVRTNTPFEAYYYQQYVAVRNNGTWRWMIRAGALV